MPKWLTLTLFILGCTLVPFIFVWGNTANWRTALKAWGQFAMYMGALMLGGGLIGLIGWLILLAS